MVDIGLRGKHRNTMQSRMFFVDLTLLYVIPGVESVLWRYIA